jgi:hypothetical protein
MTGDEPSVGSVLGEDDAPDPVTPVELGLGTELAPFDKGKGGGAPDPPEGWLLAPAGGDGAGEEMIWEFAPVDGEAPGYPEGPTDTREGDWLLTGLEGEGELIMGLDGPGPSRGERSGSTIGTLTTPNNGERCWNSARLR